MRLLQLFSTVLLFFFSMLLFCQVHTASTQVSTFTLKAPELQTTKKIWLYLPKKYSTSGKKYPVIYMHDAQNLFDTATSYAGEWQIDETLDKLNAQVIVVGIEHGNEKRMAELTPYKNEKYGGGAADSYLEFIVKTLKPHIDSSYKTKKEASNTILMGSSLGGLVSYYGVLKYPEIFGKAGVFSPSFWFTNDIYELTEKTPKIQSKLYFLCGDKESEDMVTDVNKMLYLLGQKRKAGLPLVHKAIIKGGQHNEKLWREGFEKAYLWLL